MSLNRRNDMALNEDKSDSFKMPLFPITREREEFQHWCFKAESALMAKKLLKYIQQPTFSLSDDRDTDFVEDPSIAYIGKPTTSTNNLAAHQHRASIAYNCIVQTLHQRQTELISTITPGNAYAVMTKLKQTYGLPLTSNTHGALLIRLTENKIQSSESISDYIARVERLISDLTTTRTNDMSARMKKHYILYGLRDDDRWKHIATTARQNDIHGQWSFEDLKQYLINEEYSTILHHLHWPHRPVTIN